MSNLHRIIWFNNQVKAGNYPNRVKLSKQFEISVRQAQRDLDYLKDSLRAPLVYSAKHRGFYYYEAFNIPSVHVNKAHKKYLSFLAYSYENFNQTPQVVEMIKLFKTLSDDEEKSDGVPVFNLKNESIKVYYQIEQAVKNKEKIKVLYNDEYKGKIELVAHPYKVFRKLKADYCVYLCDNSKNIEVFRIDRVIELQLLKTNFTISSTYREIDYRKHSAIEPFKAVIEFDSEPKYNEFIDFNKKKISDLVYEFEFLDSKRFIDELIANELWSTIHSPKWLRDKVMHKCTSVIKRLEKF